MNASGLTRLWVASLVLTGCSFHTNQEQAPVGAGKGTATSTTQPGSSTTTNAPGGARADSPGSSAKSSVPGSTGQAPVGCPAGQTLCAGQCVDLLADVNHCGQCGDACDSNHVQGLTCVQGRCEGTCEAGFADCNSNLRADGCEVDLRHDLEHCGACQVGCAGDNQALAACEHGVCVGECKDGFGDCNGDLRKDGCEVNLNQDPRHCGACKDAACAPGAKCQAGSCVLDCAPDQAECAGACVVLNTDLQHCGACEQSCSPEGMQAQACVSGECTGSCAQGRADCNESLRGDGCEVDLQADPLHCGACGVECSGQNVRIPLCSLGQCKPMCDVGFDDCSTAGNDGCETQVHSDINNCGRCGFRCEETGNMQAGATCETGACKGPCKLGFRDCNSDPADACEVDLSQKENCGGCGVDCVRDLHFSLESATCQRNGDTEPYRCQGQCQPRFADCDGDIQTGCEVDLRVNREHCGACGQACDEGLVCDNERCVSPS